MKMPGNGLGLVRRFDHVIVFFVQDSLLERTQLGKLGIGEILLRYMANGHDHIVPESDFVIRKIIYDYFPVLVLPLRQGTLVAQNAAGAIERQKVFIVHFLPLRRAHGMHTTQSALSAPSLQVSQLRAG
jgi:hypothetical protein